MHNIDIKLRPSKIFIFLILLTLACSLVIIAFLPVLPSTKIILFLFTMAYGWYLIWDCAMMRGTHAVPGLIYIDDVWHIQDRLKLSAAELCGESTVTSFLSILRFKLPGQRKKRSCLLFRDALGPDLYRKLVVTLRTTEIKK